MTVLVKKEISKNSHLTELLKLESSAFTAFLYTQCTSCTSHFILEMAIINARQVYSYLEKPSDGESFIKVLYRLCTFQ